MEMSATHTIRALDTDEFAELLLAARTRQDMLMGFRDEIGDTAFAASGMDVKLRKMSAVLTALRSNHTVDNGIYWSEDAETPGHWHTAEGQDCDENGTVA